MKQVLKKAVSVVLSLCLAASLFVGLDVASVAAAEYGSLQNGALTASTEGWTFTGDFSEVEDGADQGYMISSDQSGYLSVWSSKTETGNYTFSMSQTIENLAEGSYIASVAIVGNGSQGASTSKDNLMLTVKNDTQETQVSKKLVTDGWDNWSVDNSTDALAVTEGDSVTIIISGELEEKEWYGIKNVQFYADTAGDPVEAPINVEKVPGLSEDFIHGVDVSTYMSEIQSGVKYYDENGEEKNMFEIFKEGGVNYVRLRVWNCPFRVDEDGKYLYVDDEGNEYSEDEVTTTQDANGFNVYSLTEGGTTVYREGYGAGNCDIDAAVATGKIATDYGMKVLIDFHYSDFWADPAKYKAPKAWEGMNIEEKASALSTYTTECLQKLKAAGVDVGMVQIGNEINGGMAGENNMDNICTLLKAGSAAVRAVDSDILIAVHYADPHKAGYQLGKAAALDAAGVDYDVFASSYYSFWHGSTDNLTSVLSSIATTYNKKVMVAEVSYCSTLEDGDGAANVVNSTTSPLNYSIDAEGQAAAVRDAIAAVAAVGEAGIGTFYWEPAWIPAQNWADAEDSETVLASNIDKWQKYGSGWASKWSGPEGDDYDPGVDTDQSTHGSQWDNQAMFDFDGKALPSVNVYKWVYTGAEGPIRVATVDSASYTMNYKETPTLPSAVNVNLNDGNVVENVAVTWNADQVAALATADFGEYTIDGALAGFSYDSKGDTITVEAGTHSTTCKVTVTGTNHAVDPGFEEGGSAWTLTNTAGTGNPSVKTDGAAGNSKSGNNYYDAWAKEALDFTVEQTIAKDESLPAKKYVLYAYYQGTNVAEISEDASLFAEITYSNGVVERYSAPFEIPGTWKQFYQAKVKDILINDNVTQIRIGTRMACTGNDSGAWVVIDDINLMEADDLTEEEASYLPPMDADALNKVINDTAAAIEELSESDYTAESWKALSDALASASALLENEEATSEDYEAAKAAIETALSGLKKNETQISDPTQDENQNTNQDENQNTNQGGSQTTNQPENPAQDGNETKAAVLVSSISFQPASYKIAAGKKVTVVPSVAPENADNQAVTYQSSNTKYATVNSKGVVTTKKAGAGKTVTITATAADGSGVSAKVKITIMKNAVTKITLKAKAKTVKAGRKVTVAAKVKTNGKKANQKLAWSSSNTKYATVNSKGVVTTKKAGAGKTVTITAKSTDGTNKKASVKIKIRK